MSNELVKFIYVTIFGIIALIMLSCGVFYLTRKDGKLRVMLYQKYFAAFLVWTWFALVVAIDIPRFEGFYRVGIIPCLLYLIASTRLTLFYRDSKVFTDKN